MCYKIANAATEMGGSGAALGKPYEPNGVVKNEVEFYPASEETRTVPHHGAALVRIASLYEKRFPAAYQIRESGLRVAEKPPPYGEDV